MNSLDKQYTELLQDILDNGIEKKDRTGTGTLSVFGRQIRHNMSEGFPLLTTKKMAWNSIKAELLWFLKGSTDIRDLWKEGCYIWDGDWYKHYKTTCLSPYSLKEMKDFAKAGSFGFHSSTFSLGPIYGKQWRNWKVGKEEYKDDEGKFWLSFEHYDQIKDIIEQLKYNPDSRRMMVNAWNVGDLSDMVLPPCHYGFQVWTRELMLGERLVLAREQGYDGLVVSHDFLTDELFIPERAISLMWNQRSVDTFLGLPFNIASYGLLLEILAKEVNMIPDELIGNLGDTHLYSNHVEQAKEQIGREYTDEERRELLKTYLDEHNQFIAYQADLDWNEIDKQFNLPKRTREPYPLTKLMFMDHLKGFDSIIDIVRVKDFILDDYKSHPEIKAPLSN